MRYIDITPEPKYPLYTRVNIKFTDRFGYIDAYANEKYRIKLDSGNYTWEYEYRLIPISKDTKSSV